MNSVYIAMSIDGYIATTDNSVAWLDQFNTLIMEKPEGYFAKRYTSYYQTIDTIVQGLQTYEVVRGLGAPYPYSDKPNYILTRGKRKSEQENIIFLTVDEYLKLNLGTKNWIVGGGIIIRLLLEQQAIDELIITVMPVLLGAGIRLFSEMDSSLEQAFDLVDVVEESGMIELTYQKRLEKKE